jgi:hypothetical protein
MVSEIHKNSLLEDIQKLIGSIIYTHESSFKQEFLNLQIYYRTWEEQIKNDCITDYKLFKWVENQIGYWGPKYKGYVKYLESLLDKSTK